MSETVPQLPASAATFARIDDRRWTLTAPPGAHTVELTLPAGPAFLLDGSDELFVLPNDGEHRLRRRSGRPPARR